jgi:hypothetical protein
MNNMSITAARLLGEGVVFNDAAIKRLAQAMVPAVRAAVQAGEIRGLVGEDEKRMVEAALTAMMRFGTFDTTSIPTTPAAGGAQPTVPQNTPA